MIYNQGDIILVPFPYSDLSATKKRPVLVISSNYYNAKFQDIIVCALTSNKYKDEFSVLIERGDVSKHLPEKSIVKTHKILTISKTKVIKKYSSVTSLFFKKITQKLNLLLG